MVCSAACKAACVDSRSSPASVSITGIGQPSCSLAREMRVKPRQGFLPRLLGRGFVVGIPGIAMETVIGLGITDHLGGHLCALGRGAKPLDFLDWDSDIGVAI